MNFKVTLLPFDVGRDINSFLNVGKGSVSRNLKFSQKYPAVVVSSTFMEF